MTEFQQEYLHNCSHRWNVKTGATRSGKTYLDCAVTIPKRICAARGEGLLVLMGNTLGTLERNVLSLMRELWGPDLVGVIRTSAAGNVVQLFGKKVYVLGADNKSTSPASRALPLSTSTVTKSPHGTKACSRC
ncbi:MAG: hypothetical protein ACLRRU_09285 [Faecalibacterium sp.]